MKRTKKTSKIDKKINIVIPNPFDISSYKTERTAVAVLMHWMRQIIEKQNLDLGLPDVETGGKDRRFPDTIIYKTQRSKDIICLFELKPPFCDPFREDDPKEPARKKATSRHVKYFVTSNFRELILWNTEKVNASKPEEEQIVSRYYLSDIYDLDLIEENRYKASIISSLEKFLIELYELSTGAKAEKPLAIDELLIWRLQEKIKKLAYYYQTIIYDKAHKDKDFSKSLAKWFNDQGWNFYIENEDDYQKVARQTAYLLVNKILFYDTLQIKRPDKLDPLKIPDDITKGGILKDVLQSYFNAVLRIDYETVYTTDFIDTIAFPDSREVVDEIKELINVLRRYDFSTLGFDIIGRIFERLIPERERHNLGQYFTNPDVVDLILQFCIKNENDKVFDPSCGAGTFLVRAYQFKKLMNQRLSHEEILNALWGNDIAKFPAHLATINLAINDLSVEKNYPRIIRKDFFDLLSPSEGGFQIPEDVRKVLLKTMSNQEFKIIHPRWFDVIIGNPPYTRQEEISEISSEQTYKEELINKALDSGKGIQKLATISKRAGVYVYFFVHGMKFLKNGGRFGFVVSNAWLDVEYGAGLKEFFLKNYKIVAIIESKIERWFEDADINTCIIVLEKAVGKEKKIEREENLVRFVYLLKPLRSFIPAAQDIWGKQIERKQAIDKLIKTVLAHNEFYQNDELRIFPKKQSELWDEGFDHKKQKYVGSKWGRYIRAPEIFFKILDKTGDKLERLSLLAEIDRGEKSGADSFFYLDLEKIKELNIADKYWKTNGKINYLLSSPNDSETISIGASLKNIILNIKDQFKDIKDKNIKKYIKRAEQYGYNKRKTCLSRKLWHRLNLKEPSDILFPLRFRLSYKIFMNTYCYADHSVADLRLFKKDLIENLIHYLNSTISFLFLEIYGREYGGGGAPIELSLSDLRKLFVLKAFYLKKIHYSKPKFIKRKIGTIFEELGAKNSKEVSLDKVKPDRRELDKIVMGEILGLTNEEQLEVYRALIDLVKSRIEKAKSFGKKKKTKTGIDIDALVNIVLEKIGDKKLNNWYKKNILRCKDLQTKKLPALEGVPKVERNLFGWQIKNGKQTIECGSKDEAHYLKIWLEAGVKSVKIPKDEKYLKKSAKELENHKLEIDSIIESYIGSILDQKLKSQILHQIWQKIT